MRKRKIDRRPRNELGELLPVKQEPANMRDLGTARAQLRLAQAENELLRPLKEELAALRASVADHVYGLSLIWSDSQI